MCESSTLGLPVLGGVSLPLPLPDAVAATGGLLRCGCVGDLMEGGGVAFLARMALRFSTNALDKIGLLRKEAESPSETARLSSSAISLATSSDTVGVT